MMPLSFPLMMSYDDIANLEGAADAFAWDDSYDDTLPEYISDYSSAFHSCEKLKQYLECIGYHVESAPHGKVLILNENALHMAAALFATIQYEYDATDLPDLPHPTIAGATQPATWQLFGLGGDDDVDYCGTQPSCLTDLLLAHLSKEA